MWRKVAAKFQINLKFQKSRAVFLDSKQSSDFFDLSKRTFQIEEKESEGPFP